MTTTRWILYDPVAVETWTMPINPDSVSPIPARKRSLRFARGQRADQRVRTMATPAPIGEFTWAGVIRTEAHYNTLVAWAKKTNAIQVTDHRGKVYRVFINSFDPTDRPPTRRTSWRLRYTMKTSLLEGPT